MSEDNFWDQIHAKMRPFGLLKRVENRIDKGTPDVAYRLSFLRRPTASGWVELKYLDHWPVDKLKEVVIDHLTLEQVMWLEEWAERDGRAWLVARIGNDVLALTPAVARLLHKRQLTRSMLCSGATGYWPYSPFPVRGLLEVLTA